MIVALQFFIYFFLLIGVSACIFAICSDGDYTDNDNDDNLVVYIDV